MFDPRPNGLPVVDDSPSAGAMLLGPEPPPIDVARMERILAVQADEDAAYCRVPGALRVDPGLETLRGLGSQAFTHELFTRTAFAHGVRAVHAYVVEALSQDRTWTGVERSEAMELAEHDLAAALGVTRRTARIRIEDAALLVESCPRTLAVLEAGYLPVPSARELARRLGDLPADREGFRAAVEAAVLDRLGEPEGLALGSMDLDELALTAGLFPAQVATVSVGASRARVRTLVARYARRLVDVHPASEAEAAPDDRDSEAPSAARSVDPCPGEGVQAWPTRPGFAFVGSEMTEADATVALELNDQLAHSSKRAGDPRSLSQLRADWFRDLLTSRPGGRSANLHDGGPDEGEPDEGEPDGDDGRAVPVPVHLTVHLLDGRTAVDTDPLGPVAPETLTDLMAAAGETGGQVRIRPATLPGCDGHAWVDDRVVDAGPYVVPDRLREAVHVRDGTCRFPGCGVPARSCDLDHTVPHPRGPTCSCNLACLCRSHHRLKTHGRWRLINHGAGSLTWMSPTGQVLESVPDPP